MATRVLIAGAGGRTGGLLFKKLINSSTITPVGLVKSKKSIKQLKKLGAKDDQIVFGDITDPTTLDKAFEGVDSVILATSAVPKIKIFSLIKVLILKLFGKTARPEFYFGKNGDPYYVDWLGAKNQIDAAKKAGVKQFVFISSMGGTQPENFLNTIGRKIGDELSGNILLWKRKAEQYLIESGIPYTIIHPGGLIDKPGGEREILYGVDDTLLNGTDRSIPRADVAEVAIQSLLISSAKNKAFDISSKAPGVGVITTDWVSFFSNRPDYKY